MVLPILLITLAILIGSTIVVWRHFISLRGKSTRLLFKSVIIIIIGGIVAIMLFGRFHKGLMPHWFNAMTAIYTLLFLLTSMWITLGAGGLLLDRKRGKRGWCRAAVVLSAIVTAVVLYGSIYGRNFLRVEEVTIESDRLPASFDGMRIAFFSDLHLSSMYGREKMARELVDQINRLTADAVIFGGDLVTSTPDELTSNYRNVLSQISSHHGTYSVLGNHDLGIYADTTRNPRIGSIAKMTAMQRGMGWKVLRNSFEVITSEQGEKIAIVGVEYPEELLLHSHRHPTQPSNYNGVFDSLPQDMFRITIAHAPQVWDDLREMTYSDLTLSGHVHSMQMKLTICGHSWSPARLFYDRWSGLYEEDGQKLYINDGIGSVVIPTRIGARPEITLITLRSTKNRQIK